MEQLLRRTAVTSCIKSMPPPEDRITYTMLWLRWHCSPTHSFDPCLLERSTSEACRTFITNSFCDITCNYLLYSHSEPGFPKTGFSEPNISHLVNLNKTIFQPCIDYCITIWGCAADKHLNKVQRIINRASRIISGNFEYDVRGVELLKQLVLRTSKERRDYLMGLLVYKCVNGIARTVLFM